MTDNATSPSTPRHTPLWAKIVTWILGIVFTLSLTLIISVTAALWWLSPERLTPLVNGFLSSYLDADVNIGRVELTFWSSFPHVELQVDSLDVVSRRFRNLSPDVRASLPADADSLASVERFSGGIHLLKLMHSEVDLYDIELTNPKANLVVAPDSTANFDILPPSKPSEEPTKMPKVNINRFALFGSFPIRYRALADSIDLQLRMNATELSGIDAPQYTLSLSGGASPKLPDYKIPHIPFAINGNIGWDQATPDVLKFSGMEFTILGNKMLFNALLSLAEPLTLHEFDITIPQVRPGKMLRLFAPDNPELARLDTDLTIDLQAQLLKPYSPAVSELPRMEVNVGLNASKVKYEKLDLTALHADITTIIDDADLDRSTVDIRRLRVAGRAIDFEVSGTLRSLLSDPRIDGRFKGSVALDRLPEVLTAKLPCSVGGTLTGDASFGLRKSMLNRKDLHRIKLDGNLTLDNLRVDASGPHGPAEAYVSHARFDLGTDSQREIGNRNIDSLLTASLTVDSISVTGPGLKAAARGLQANLGSRNVAASADTSSINPFGGSITVDRFSLSADSAKTRVLLRDVKASGALMRYNNEARAPRVEMRLHTGRLAVGSRSVRTSIADADVSLSFHPRGKRQMSVEMQSRYDSLAVLYPHLSTDSLRAMARRDLRRDRQRATNPNDRENIDFNIDNSLASWLRLWQLSGSITANKARLYTPHFPIHNRVSDLDMDFSTDSVFIRNTRVESGHSDFLINGSIRNITRALTSRSRRVPLEIDFDVKSDTIDINELSATLIRGEAYTHSPEGHHSALVRLIDEELEIAEDYVDISIEEPPTRAILVPSNIRANVRVRADNILYTNLLFHNFDGHVGVFDGAVDLDRLHAETDIGSVELTALYSAPTRNELQFAAGLKIHRLQLHQVLKMLPSIDSLMPMLSSISGVVDATVAVTTELDSTMNINLPTMDVAVRLMGDSLVLLDSETFRTVAKWMMFKNKKDNMIDHMDVQVMVQNGAVNLYPMIFQMDRYRIGVAGHNDLALNLDYHVAVLKSPLPFRFGVNIKGTPEKLKISLGKARINEKEVAEQKPFADTIRVNLLAEMHRLFALGIRASGISGLRNAIRRGSAPGEPMPADADSSQAPVESMLELIRQGLIDLEPRGMIAPERQEQLKKVGKAAKRLANQK